MRIITVLAMLVLALASCSRHQPPDPNDVYREVPDADREALRAAVQQMASYQAAGEWDKMYELVSEPRDSKDRFQRLRAAARPLKSFQPTAVSWLPDGWVVTGCGVWEARRNQPDAVVSSLRATSTKAGWRLTAVQTDVFANEPGNVKPCSSPAR